MSHTRPINHTSSVGLGVLVRVFSFGISLKSGRVDLGATYGASLGTGPLLTNVADCD